MNKIFEVEILKIKSKFSGLKKQVNRVFNVKIVFGVDFIYKRYY